MTELNTENVDRIFADCMFRSHEEYEEFDILPHLKEWDSGVIGGNLHRRTYAASSQS